MTANLAAGWALIAAVAIGIVASLLTPGGLTIDPADTASFAEAAGVLGDNSSLAQAMTFLLVVSVSLFVGSGCTACTGHSAAVNSRTAYTSPRALGRGYL